MNLPKDLIREFVSITKNDKKEVQKVFEGTFIAKDGKKYVRINGSEVLTPVNTVVEAHHNDKVKVEIENHKANVVQNITYPMANLKTVNNIKDNVDEHGNSIKQLNTTTTNMNSVIQNINSMVSNQDTTINNVKSDITNINSKIKTQGTSIEQINSNIQTVNSKLQNYASDISNMGSSIENLRTNIRNIDTKIDNQNSTITNIDSKIRTNSANINILNSSFNIENGVVTGLKKAILDNIEAKVLTGKYANIDFANINELAVKNLFTKSGMIKDLVVKDSKITGELVGVTIKGDLIEGNTIKADKLLVKGSDGLFYKLNTDGKNITGEQTDYNSLSGSIITARSITADKVTVSDLKAFGADIGRNQNK